MGVSPMLDALELRLIGLTGSLRLPVCQARAGRPCQVEDVGRLSHLCPSVFICGDPSSIPARATIIGETMLYQLSYGPVEWSRRASNPRPVVPPAFPTHNLLSADKNVKQASESRPPSRLRSNCRAPP